MNLSFVLPGLHFNILEKEKMLQFLREKIGTSFQRKRANRSKLNRRQRRNFIPFVVTFYFFISISEITRDKIVLCRAIFIHFLSRRCFERKSRTKIYKSRIFSDTKQELNCTPVFYFYRKRDLVSPRSFWGEIYFILIPRVKTRLSTTIWRPYQKKRKKILYPVRDHGETFRYDLADPLYDAFQTTVRCNIAFWIYYRGINTRHSKVFTPASDKKINLYRDKIYRNVRVWITSIVFLYKR